MAITAGHPQFSDDYRFIEQAHSLVGVGEDIRERTHFAEVSNVVLGKTVNGHANLIDVVRARPVAKEFLPIIPAIIKKAYKAERGVELAAAAALGLIPLLLQNATSSRRLVAGSTRKSARSSSP